MKCFAHRLLFHVLLCVCSHAQIKGPTHYFFEVTPRCPFTATNCVHVSVYVCVECVQVTRIIIFSVFRSVCLCMKEKTEEDTHSARKGIHVHRVCMCVCVHLCNCVCTGAFIYAAFLCPGALNKWYTEQKALAGLLVY